MPSQASARASDRTVATNRRARHDYEVLETVEAGLVLRGTEVKSLRAGQVITVGTDGVWEMPNGAGERFGKSRLRAVIRAAAGFLPLFFVPFVSFVVSALMPPGSLSNQLVEGPAVGTARLARLLDGQIDARVRVPQLLRGQRAVQRQVRRRHLEELAVKLGRQRHSWSRRRG